MIVLVAHTVPASRTWDDAGWMVEPQQKETVGGRMPKVCMCMCVCVCMCVCAHVCVFVCVTLTTQRMGH